MSTSYQELSRYQNHRSKNKVKYRNEVHVFEIPNLLNIDRCYYSHNKFLDAVIALSDFSNDGWKMSKSKVNLSIDHILIAGKLLTFI